MFRRRQQPAQVPAEQPGPRTIGDQLRQQIRDQARDILMLRADITELYKSIATRDRRIAALQSANHALGEQLAAAQKDAERARERVFMLGNAANHREQQHETELNILRTQLAEARQPLVPSDDADPTGPVNLPTPEAVTSLRITTADPDLLTPWPHGAWQSRSSAGQSAPIVGEQ